MTFDILHIFRGIRSVVLPNESETPGHNGDTV